MRVALLLMALAACGPGLKAKAPSKVSAKDALAAAATDVDQMTQLLRGPFVNGGLWFADAGCAAKFPGGEVAPSERTELARCLVGLNLIPSPREDALGDVVVMTYAPGFEVEARVVQDLGGPPALVWIGFSAKRAQDRLPTISGTALETLREAGDPDGPIDPKHGDTFLNEDPTVATTGAAPPKPAFALTWLKVCLDATGAVTEVDPYLTSSVVVQAAFVDAAHAWKFRPFTIGEAAIPVCAMVRMIYPPHATADVEVLPLPPPPSRSKKVKKPLVLTNPRLVEGKRISGTRAIAPDDLTKLDIHHAGLSQLEGSFRVCIDDQGLVESVLPVRSTGILRYDARLIAGMQQWRYSPYLVNDEPVPVCTHVTFRYSQTGTANTANQPNRIRR